LGLWTILGLIAQGAAAADYRVTVDAPSLMYDAPSAKARPQFLFGPDVPVEVLVQVEGWTKVRDVGGSIGWMANRSLGDKHMLVVRTAAADVRANPDDSAPQVLRAEQGVLLEMAETATSSATTATPGWVKVRHRDGVVGFVRISQVFGL
jgi:SH3-like domain-containing protein